MKREICRIVEKVRSENQEVYHLFDVMDTDKSGSLSVKEFRTGLRVMGINLAPSMATKVAHRFDADGTNSIDYLEMFALLASHELPPRDRRQLRLEERRRIEAERDASGLKPLGLDLDSHTEDGSDSDGNQSAQSAMKVVQGTRRIVRVAPETLASLGLPTHIEPRRSKVANKSTAPPIEDSLPALNGIEEQDGKAVLHAVMPSTATPPEKEAYLSDLFTRKFQKSRVKELHSFTVNDLKGLTKIELASLLVARDYPYEDIEPIFGNHQVLEQIGAALGRLQFSFRWELFCSLPVQELLDVVREEHSLAQLEQSVHAKLAARDAPTVDHEQDPYVVILDVSSYIPGSIC